MKNVTFVHQLPAVCLIHPLKVIKVTNHSTSRKLPLNKLIYNLKSAFRTKNIEFIEMESTNENLHA